ncbi:MAG: hypothetical protein LIO44_03050, partial [Eubacterium sp.]|nr:hypothetical protein [Eubacterium sp.]
MFDNPENSEVPYADILGLEAGDFDEISLEKDIYPMLSVSLTARPLNALRRNDCFTLGNLLLMTPSKLRRIKNMGLKSVKEIESLFMKISNTSVRKKLVSTSVKTMFSGKQGYADELSDDEKTYIIKAKEAAAILGNEFCLDIIQNDRKEYIKCIIDVFAAFGQRISVRREIAASAEKAAADWDEAIYSKKLLPFVRLYCLSHKRYVSDDFKKFMSADVLAADYVKMIKSQPEVLNDYRNDILVKELAEFQAWMTGINLMDFCKKAFDRSNWIDSKSKYSFDVLTDRANGRTLEEIARQYGITRERVRQIEKKMLKYVYKRLPKRIYNIFGLISAYRNGEHILYKDGIIETIGQEYGSILWHCASHFENRSENTYMLDTKIGAVKKLNFQFFTALLLLR